MKKIKMFLSGLLIFILFVASDCHRKDFRYIYLENLSEKQIYYLPSFNYPDTLLKVEEKPPVSNKIGTNDKTVFGPGSDIFENYHTIIFFILDADSVEILSWDTIVKRNIILKRYEVTQSYMSDHNWIITYP